MNIVGGAVRYALHYIMFLSPSSLLLSGVEEGPGAMRVVNGASNMRLLKGKMWRSGLQRCEVVIAFPNSNNNVRRLLRNGSRNEKVASAEVEGKGALLLLEV